VSLPISTIVVGILIDRKLAIRDYMLNSLIICASFLIFNFWWIYQWILALPEISDGYSMEFAKNSMMGTHLCGYLIIPKILSFTTILNPDDVRFGFTQPLVSIVWLIPAIVVFFFSESYIKI
jgi:hypothetical protein